jgi:hypothetical protein
MRSHWVPELSYCTGVVSRSRRRTDSLKKTWRPLPRTRWRRIRNWRLNR